MEVSSGEVIEDEDVEGEVKDSGVEGDDRRVGREATIESGFKVGGVALEELERWRRREGIRRSACSVLE